MKPLEEDWHEDSGRNYNAGNDGEMHTERKSFNPNFSNENRLRSNGDSSVKRPRKRVGETRFNVEGTPDEASNANHQYRQGGGYQSNNRRGNYEGGGYNNNRGGYNNNRGGGYNNNRGGGYNNNRGGGYNNNYRENNNSGDYNNNYGSENGYNQSNYNNQGGGYNNNRNNGYNQGGGGYNNNRYNQGGGYNNGNRGGYSNNRGNYGNQGQCPSNNYGNRPNSNYSRGGNGRQQGFGNNNNNWNRNITRPIEYRSIVEDPSESIRLNKFLANAGICSRREADELIQAGVVSVNGAVVSELGTKILRGDKVMIHDQLVSPDKKIYLLLNKPKDCVTTSDDPYAKTTVMDLVKNACHERIYPVGRLDRNTTGVLLLTNDGDLAAKLTHPKYNKKKIYQVSLDKVLEQEDLDRMLTGITLEDGEIKADGLEYFDEEDHKKIGIEIHSGRNRIVRRIFEHLGYRVMRLDRVYFAGLTKKNLRRGQWRFLSEKEVNMLRMGAFE